MFIALFNRSVETSLFHINDLDCGHITVDFLLCLQPRFLNTEVKVEFDELFALIGSV